MALNWNRPSLDDGYAELHNIITDIDKDADRVVAIVGHALVESALESLIVAHCPSKAGSNDGFVTKLKTAFNSKWIPREVAANLDTINDIRNIFAHSVRHVTFRTVFEGNGNTLQERKSPPWRKTYENHGNVPEMCRSLTLPERHKDILNDLFTTGRVEGQVSNSGDDRVMFVDELGAIGIVFATSVSDSKSRFLVSVKLGWSILEILASAKP